MQTGTGACPYATDDGGKETKGGRGLGSTSRTKDTAAGGLWGVIRAIRAIRLIRDPRQREPRYHLLMTPGFWFCVAMMRPPLFQNRFEIAFCRQDARRVLFGTAAVAVVF